MQDDRPLMVYDGDCDFCRRWIARWQRQTGNRIAYAPSQEVARLFPKIPPAHFKQSVHLIEPNGQISTGAHAVFRSLALAGKRRWLLDLYRRLPGFAPIAEATYRFVSHHRRGLNTLENLVSPTPRPCCSSSRALLLPLLGATCLIAFASLRKHKRSRTH